MEPFGQISQYTSLQQGSSEYIRLNFPTILSFLQKYFQWLEQNQTSLLLGPIQGIFSLLDQRDIDKALVQFLPYFLFEYLNSFPATMLADQRKLSKHIKDFYLSRGSEKSFSLLFKILYNDIISFYYPKTDLIIPDNGKWSVDTVIRTTTTTDTYQFIGRKIVGVTSGATANVENVIQVLYGNTTVSEIYISNLSIIGSFQVGETVQVNLIDSVATENLYGLATGIDITNSGTAYNSGDLIIVSGANTTALFEVNVTSGTNIGRVVQAGFANYPEPATIQLALTASNIDNFYQNMYITITDGSGSAQQNYITSYNGTSKVAVLSLNWKILPDITSHYNIALGNIQTIKVKDFGYNYTSPIAADFTLAGNGNATGTINVGAVGYYAGRYVNNDGFLDYRKYLQDDYYYQNFSYVLKTKELLKTYNNIVKQILHPAGLQLFGNVLVENNILKRKIHNITGIITPTESAAALPESGLEVQYQMLQDNTNTQLLYDIKDSVYPSGYNSILGSLSSIDIDDPTWETVGLQFSNTFVNSSLVPINTAQQTIMVIANVTQLQDGSGIIGCIDNDNDYGVTGYQINVNSDGSITFRSQKMNLGQNDLRVSYPAGSINTSNYFFASLRYFNNTLVGNLNQLPPIVGSYGSNVDATNIISNSRKYYIGIGGFHPSLSSPHLYKSGLYGSTLFGIPSVMSLPATLMSGYFKGMVSYVLIYNRFLTNQEILNSYEYLRGIMSGRGITLY
jgi:hypothetical protein